MLNNEINKGKGNRNNIKFPSMNKRFSVQLDRIDELDKDFSSD